MARPVKNNAEYFSHDADMRNDVRIKAVRKKFKAQGYAIWNMVIEYLTDQDYFKFQFDELTLELLSGDFDEETQVIKDVVEYCVKLDLLQNEEGFIKCKTLEKRLESVLTKRKLAKERVSVTETTQSKVKESKVQNSKEKEIKKAIVEPGKPATTPKESLEEKVKKCDEREKAFYETLVPYVEQYGKPMIRKFYDHWRERNKSRTRLKFEMEDTWDVKLRLIKWEGNANKFDKGLKAESDTNGTEYQEQRAKMEQRTRQLAEESQS